LPPWLVAAGATVVGVPPPFPPVAGAAELLPHADSAQAPTTITSTVILRFVMTGHTAGRAGRFTV